MSDCGDVKKVFVPTKREKQKESIAEQAAKRITGIEISDKSVEKIKLFLDGDNKSTEEYGLKIGVRKDGCSGKSYVMDLARISESVEAGDKIFKKDGATVMIEKLSYMFVLGSRLDFVEALTGSGFQLVNPNIKGTCSCGSSFKV